MVVVFPVVLLLIRNHPSEKGMVPVGGYPKVDPFHEDTNEVKTFQLGSITEETILVYRFTFCCLWFYDHWSNGYSPDPLFT